MNDSIKKRFIPKSLKKKEENSYSDIFYQDGVQQGDAGITLPNKIEVRYIALLTRLYLTSDIASNTRRRYNVWPAP